MREGWKRLARSRTCRPSPASPGRYFKTLLRTNLGSFFTRMCGRLLRRGVSDVCATLPNLEPLYRLNLPGEFMLRKVSLGFSAPLLIVGLVGLVRVSRVECASLMQL